MIRMQISLNDREYSLARKQAAKLGISVAELIQRAIREFLSLERCKPWMQYAGFVESGNRGSSHSIDGVVYGQ